MLYSGGFVGPVALGGERGFTSHNPRCLRTCPPLEDLFDDVLILDHADDFHLSGTFRAGQGVYFVNLLDQPSRGG